MMAYINAIARDNMGNIWFAGTGLVKFDGTNWIGYSNGEYNNADLDYMAIDRQGNSWLATDHIGILKVDSMYWTNFTTSNGISNNSVESIAIDPQGNKWFGTQNGVSELQDRCEITTVFSSLPFPGILQ